ncbi:MAG: DUF2085 domain-containing protein [Chloroflexales bacterium]|nr:DUF2085 domain-containing protein [Chloroflexales bacterium]
MDKSPDEVLELARRSIAERKVEAQHAATLQGEARFERERPWRAAFVGAMAVLLAALLFTPGPSVDQKMLMVARGICAQEHTVALGGLIFPICARNTGIYASASITFLFLLLVGRQRAGAIPPLPIALVLVAFVFIMAIDGFNSVFVDLGQTPLYQPQNWLRTLTGLGMGVTLGCTMLLILNSALRQDVRYEQPVLGSWRELGGILAIDFLALAALYGNAGWLYWPLALLAWGGILGVMYGVNLMLVAVFTGYEGKITRPAQLAKPAVIALGTTLLLVLGLAALRLWLESQGLVA